VRYDTARLQLYMYMCGRSCELELYRSWMLLVSESLDARRWQHVRTCDVRSPIFVISFSFCELATVWRLCCMCRWFCVQTSNYNPDDTVYNYSRSWLCSINETHVKVVPVAVRSPRPEQRRGVTDCILYYSISECRVQSDLKITENGRPILQ
jgi:hypothetical protein